MGKAQSSFSVNKSLVLADKTIETVLGFWRNWSQRSTSVSVLNPELPGDQLSEVHHLIRQCLSCNNEVTARARASHIGIIYKNLDSDGKRKFLTLLTREFGLDKEKVKKSSASYLNDPLDHNAYQDFQRSMEPDRIRLIRMFNSLPDGFEFLVNLRADLLDFIAEEPCLKILDYDLRKMFEMWFDVDLLTFQRITWNSSANLLEKLIEYEEVHQISSWDDLKNRLDEDRRCYAFIHPNIKDEPLIFVEVALTIGTPVTISSLLDEGSPLLAPDDADTAVFYSISSTQKGLRGISYGNFLLKRVVDNLSSFFPHLENYLTLSPIPGFRSWVEKTLFEPPFNFPESLSGEELECIRSWFNQLLEYEQSKSVDVNFIQKFTRNGNGKIKKIMTQLCAYYLMFVRRSTDQMPVDPIARFHLRNGARIHQINWMADPSKTGLQQSLGMMVNYQYVQGNLEQNHESLFNNKFVVASKAVQTLSKRFQGDIATNGKNSPTAYNFN